MAITEGTILRIVANMVFPDDVIMQNVFHAVLTTVVGDNDAEDVTDDMNDYADAIYNEFAGSFDSQMTGSDVKVYEYDSVDDDWDEIGTGTLTLPTGFAGEQLPHGVALVQNYFTSDPDIQGRKFWGGLIENSLVDGAFDANLIADAVAAAVDVTAQFTAPTTANVYTPGVWSPTKTLLVAYTGVVSTSTIPGYQRRRKPGVGI